jgi:hypothetical protein
MIFAFLFIPLLCVAAYLDELNAPFNDYGP